jgi:hypothetical protein
MKKEVVIKWKAEKKEQETKTVQVSVPDQQQRIKITKKDD